MMDPLERAAIKRAAAALNMALGETPGRMTVPCALAAAVQNAAKARGVEAGDLLAEALHGFAPVAEVLRS